LNASAASASIDDGKQTGTGMAIGKELHVTAAGAYEHVLNELIPLFTEECGVPVRLAVANAAGVIKRLEAKETVDVVLTSAAGIEHLIVGGLVERAGSGEIGRMRLGVAVAPGLPMPDLSTANSVRSFLLAAPHVAYIDPKGGGTSGPFIAKLFERLGVADHMNQNGVLSKTGKDVVRAVESGAATCGLTQASELIGAKGVQFAGYLPAELQVVSVYAGAIATQTRAPDLAGDFIRFLKSPKSVEAFRNAGWDAG
jgi:molybdate transport system substrate-binding protein